MAGDLHYKLIVDMETRGTLAPQLDKVGKSGGDLSKLKDTLGTIGSSIGGMASSLGSAFTGAVEGAAGVVSGLAKIGAVAAGGAIAYGVVGLNNELELTKTSLAAILNAQGMGGSGGMSSALGASSDIMARMRKDAAQLPGEMKDLLGFFRLGATPGFQAGASVDKMEKLSANAMAASAALGMNQEQAAREFAMLLQGRAGAHNILGLQLGFSGAKATSFNAESGQARLKDIEGALGKYEPAIAEFSKTFDALSSTMKDNAKSVLGKATLPLFDSVKKAMSDSNRWFDAHEESVMRFAGYVGSRLSSAFETGRREIEWWGPAVLTFANNGYHEIVSIWDRIEPVVRRIGAIIQREIASPDLFKHLESTAKLYAAVKLGMMLAPAAGSVASGVFGAVSGGETAAAGAGAIATLAEAAATAAFPIAAIGLSVKGAFDILTDTSNAWHTFAMSQIKDMHESVSQAAKSAGELGTAAKPLTDLLGGDLLFSLNLTAQGFGVLGDEMSLAAGALGLMTEAGRGWGEWLGMIEPKLKELARSPNKYVHEWGRGDLTTSSGSRKDTEGMKERRGVPGGGGTNIQKVEIVVSTNQDPSRVARAVVDEMKDISRNPTSSRFVRNWGAVRP